MIHIRSIKSGSQLQGIVCSFGSAALRAALLDLLLQSLLHSRYGCVGEGSQCLHIQLGNKAVSECVPQEKERSRYHEREDTFALVAIEESLEIVILKAFIGS